MYINNGLGGFTEQAVTRGAAIQSGKSHWGWSPVFGDYDGDGFVDLYVSEWGGSAELSHSRLLRNRGAEAPGFFSDVTETAGVKLTREGSNVTYTFAPRFADFDRDGHLDLSIAADFGTSVLFWNNGNGTFTNGTSAAGVGTDENGMGSAIADYDGDGLLDWFVTSIYDANESCESQPCNWGYTGNRLYRNEGERQFSDQTTAVGVQDGQWGWGANMFDYDNDGDLDIIMTNGVQFNTTAQVLLKKIITPCR